MTQEPITAAALRSRLFALLADRAYREGDFVLASGKRSRFYFDGKTILLDGEGSRLVAKLVLAEMEARNLRPVAVGGMELGAVPMASVVSALSPAPLRIFIARKQAKEHGTGKALEGSIEPGDAVVIVEDVVTTGGSTLRAIQAVEAAGARVVGIFALLDRQEVRIEGFGPYEDRFFPLFTLEQFQQQRRAETRPGGFSP